MGKKATKKVARKKASKKGEGIIYVLTNDFMKENVVKIGCTRNPVEDRMKILYNTSAPAPFECFFACTLKNNMNLEEVEGWLHDLFGDRRTDPKSKKREFFEVDPVRVRLALQYVKKEDKTPEYHEPSDAEKPAKRQSNFRFSKVGLKKGDELHFYADRNKKAYVYDDTKIMFDEEPTSLSKAAQDLLGYVTQGPRHWMYGEETLLERRKRMEEES